MKINRRKVVFLLAFCEIKNEFPRICFYAISSFAVHGKMVLRIIIQLKNLVRKAVVIGAANNNKNSQIFAEILKRPLPRFYILKTEINLNFFLY